VLTKKDKLLAAAQKFLERGSLDKALLEFQRAAQEDPKDTRTWLRIAEINVKQGDAAEATQVYLKTASLYVEQGFFQRAAAVYKNVLKLTPGHTEAHTKLAEVYRQLGLLSDSSQQYEHAAAALVKAGRPKEAMAALGQILEMNPDQVMMRVRMGEIAAQAGLNAEAVQEFQNAADQLESQGRTEDFLRVAERVLQLAPENVALGRKAALRYMERQNPKAALAKLQACFNVDSKDVETLQLLASAFAELGQNAKTITVLKELAKVQEERRQMGERAATLQRIRSLDPTDALVADLDVPRAKRTRDEDAPHPLPAVVDRSERYDRSASGDRSERPRVRREPSITFSELAVPPILAREPSVPYLAEADTALPGLDEEQVAAEVTRILAETDTFVKYGLIERAAEHVRKVFDLAPEHEAAQERLIAILVQLGRKAEAVEELGILADRVSLSDPAAAIGHLRRAIELDPEAVGALHMLQRLTEQSTAAIAEEDPEVLELDELDEISDMDLLPMVDVAAAAPADSFDAAEISDGRGTMAAAPEPEAPAAIIEDEPGSEWDTAGKTQIDPGLEKIAAAWPTLRAPAAAAPAAAPGPSHSAPAAPAQAASPLLDELEIEFDAPGATGIVIPDLEMHESAPEIVDEFGALAPLDPAVEADLEQVDFFLEQGLPDEARAVLDELGAHLAQHPAVLARRTRIEAGQFDEATRMRVPGDGGLERVLSGDDTGAVPRGSYTDLSRSPARTTPIITPRATVALGADATTQRDLGIAYKEMGLHEAAIAEFSKLVDDTENQVFALMMIGECHEAEGGFPEALLHYKKALNRPNVRDDEATRLYFLLGRAFEALGDKGEALYFFEKVARRDARFDDVAVRVERLRRSGVAPIDHGNDDRRRQGAAPRGSR
jgi:pilus assembly protein FimV